MSRITFLDNASMGKNNWWRYLLTVILIVGSSLVFGIAILIPIFLIEILTNAPDTIFSNPLAVLLLSNSLFIVAFFMLYICIRFIHKRKFISLINTVSKVNWVRILKGTGIWSTLLLMGTILSLIINPGGFKVTFNPNTFIFLLIISLMTFPIQASFEELFFRGYLMQGIGLLSKKPVVPLLVTSVIFALGHYGNGTTNLMNIDILLQVFIIGITLGIITLGENGLETAMGVHISNNIFLSLVCNTPDVGSINLPSILTNVSTPNPVIDVPILTVYAIVLLVIVFWNKKDNVYNIFKTGKHMEIDKIEVP